MHETALKSSARSKDDLAGVFERDEGTSYFYLYETGKEILGAIDVSAQCQSALLQDIDVKWSSSEVSVGLFFKGHLIAIFRVETAAERGIAFRVFSDDAPDGSSFH
jgi:hypothetical protein